MLALTSCRLQLLLLRDASCKFIEASGYLLFLPAGLCGWLLSFLGAFQQSTASA